MSEPNSENKELYLTPSDVVADAVMKNYWDLMHQGKLYDPAKKDVSKYFEDISKGRCKDSSTNTIGYIAKSHPELFEQLLIITSFQVSPDSWLMGGGKANYIDTPPWHSYFLVKDVNGYWYAASPANEKAKTNPKNITLANEEEKKDPNYATTIFRDKSLEAIIKQIDERDKIQFPTAHFIEDSLKNFRQPFKVVNGRKLEYRQFVQVNSQNTFSSSEEFAFP